MINITLQIISMVLCVIGVIQVLIGFRRCKQPVFFIIGYYSALFLFSGCVLAELLLEGNPGDTVRVFLSLVNFMHVGLAYYIGFIIVRRLLVRIDPMKKQKALYRTAAGIFIAQIVIFAAVHFSGYCYYIDASNNTMFRDRPYIPVFIWMIWIGYTVFLLIRFRKRIALRNYIVFCVLTGVSVLAIILQIFIEEIYFATIAASIGAVILFVLTASDRANEQLRAELELEKLRVDIMLSQIKPHFLYNSLTVIKHLCRRDPELAEKAVVDFSTYLRGNMDSLSVDVPIRFEKELDHTKAYLSLEKLRFEGDLQIKFDIQSTGFYLPALTLQPIVENAVRHGVRETKDGKGTVTIAARELYDRYEITVADDGSSFEPRKNPDTDKPHIGIENVRYRLKNMCGGTLSFQSATGQGTVATISVPKGDQYADLWRR